MYSRNGRAMRGFFIRVLTAFAVSFACLFYCGAGCGNVASPSGGGDVSQQGGAELSRFWGMLQGTWVMDGFSESQQSIIFEPARVTQMSFGVPAVYPIDTAKSLITAERYEQIRGYSTGADIVVVCDNGVDFVSYITVEFLSSDMFLFGSTVYRRKGGVGSGGGGGSGNGSYSGTYIYSKAEKGYKGSFTFFDDGTFGFTGDKSDASAGGTWEQVSDGKIKMKVNYGGADMEEEFTLTSSGSVYTFSSTNTTVSLLLLHFFGF